ncbi:hypothetical protein [Bacillus atrophaeus]|uniref:hypothetical protein n=1 Tax=Bacillus atrophaeus TaxID=1452 RepID=UPI00227EA8A1|nr:hypothetical protein [Bacillus atrophaeus]MCY8466494.1 hypothetical protein [Bacillus atrophaeus]MCY8478953.1 hypothetical protein [Bacillus atrophaeus]
MRQATEKQLSLIKRMEELINIKFTGHTIKEASEFISEHMDRYQEVKEFVFDQTYYYDAY